MTDDPTGAAARMMLKLSSTLVISKANPNGSLWAYTPMKESQTPVTKAVMVLTMVADAKVGKIDLILTKSISRFARNTVDSLSMTRELKTYGTEVYFEKENISSMDAQAELLFTIMSSLAQEESRSISENVRWGVQRSMESGKISIAYSNFLGYEKGPDGLPHVVEEEAKIVRDIYRQFLLGKTYNEIANDLTSRGIASPSGKSKWTYSTVRSILTNEKYMRKLML